MEKLVITGVKVDSNMAHVTVHGVKDEPGKTLDVFRQLSKEGIVVDMILQPEAVEGNTNLVFSVEEEKAQEAVDTLMAHRQELAFDHLNMKKNVAKVTLSGTGLMSHSDIVPRVLSCFYECNASMDLISTSEIAIKVFTDEKKAMRVVEKLRDEFDDYGL
ncbi:MAG: hypothetical protein Q4E53_03555 [Eubacteriales bacterium]|nr:hypothetical protein [Eubacteriales bacterium]